MFSHHTGSVLPHGAGAHGVSGAAASAHGSAAAGGAGKPASASLAWLSPSSLLAFLAWFGGTGYLLTQYYRVWYLLGLALALLSGLLGAAIVSWFLVKVLLPHETELFDSDFELAGTLAKVTSSIREGGTGEIVYSQGGVRRCAGARGNNGQALEKGSEVVVARYENGIAYVARWEDWAR